VGRYTFIVVDFHLLLLAGVTGALRNWHYSEVLAGAANFVQLSSGRPAVAASQPAMLETQTRLVWSQQIRLAGAFRLRHAIADSTRLVKAPEFRELHAAHGF